MVPTKPISPEKGLAPKENECKVLEKQDIWEDAKKLRPYDHVWDMYYDEFEDFAG